MHRVHVGYDGETEPLHLAFHRVRRLYPHGIFRITAAAPPMAVANPLANADASIKVILSHRDSDLILLPELGLTGYTCGDLFATDALLDATEEALLRVAESTREAAAIVVVGLPWTVDDSLMNVAAVVSDGTIHGMVPKMFLPTYREFYEGRHFRSGGHNDPMEVSVDGRNVPFGTDLLFSRHEAIIALELCEDLWTPHPPSNFAALAGANILLNLSASNETIGKAAWRRDLIRSQSGRCIAAYAYAGAGPGESTSDLVFGGHCLVAENGQILGESRRIGDGLEPAVIEHSAITQDIDLERLSHDRRVIGSFDDARDHLDLDYRNISIATRSNDPLPAKATLHRYVDGRPFVPAQSAALEARCAEIFAIQTAGLTKRLTRLSDSTPLAIGVSGGLDSTLALLVAIKACDAMTIPHRRICGITMPGFGTTAHTRNNADRLIELTGITRECVDIRQLCLDTFGALGHSPLGIAIDEETTAESLQAQLLETPDDATDLVFENVQARIRTMLLMSRGFVLGTGDMSEQALGWSTYNADHMSMYNVNTSIPKTLVRFLVRYVADNHTDGDMRQLLHDIADTPISPELLPPSEEGKIRQSTEASIGPYELHDFFLFHFMRNGATREKILYLAQFAEFSEDYSEQTIEQTLEIFIRRFFSNQFKRNCVPDGPKVGSVSLSPRGDWRMPSDADPDAFLGDARKG